MEKRNNEFCLRLSAAENAKLLEDAGKCGLNRSAYLRRLIMKKVIKARPPESIHELYTEVNRIGNNINQIARSVNAGTASPKAAEQAVFMLKKVYAILDKAARG